MRPILALRCIPSTSRLPVRQLSTSVRANAASTANLPKRDKTEYGVRIPNAKARKDWPKQAETDTAAHPLWRFFHAEQSLEAPDKRLDNSSRSWTAPELRRKSFEEIHALWYILLRERNVLLTQREEARRIRLDLKGFSAAADKLRMVQKSMARVKQVLSERRHAIVEAAKILRARGEEDAAEAMLASGSNLLDELKDN